MSKLNVVELLTMLEQNEINWLIQNWQAWFADIVNSVKDKEYRRKYEIYDEMVVRSLAEQFDEPQPESKPVVKASKPVAYAPKTEATDVDLAVTLVNDGFTLGYGSGRAGAKLYIKSLGFKWDADKRCYCGADLKSLKLKGKVGAKRLTVPAKWVQAGRDKAIAKASK